MAAEAIRTAPVFECKQPLCLLMCKSCSDEHLGAAHEIVIVGIGRFLFAIKPLQQMQQLQKQPWEIDSSIPELQTSSAEAPVAKLSPLSSPSLGIKHWHNRLNEKETSPGRAELNSLLLRGLVRLDIEPTRNHERAVYPHTFSRSQHLTTVEIAAPDLL